MDVRVQPQGHCIVPNGGATMLTQREFLEARHHGCIHTPVLGAPLVERR